VSVFYTNMNRNTDPLGRSVNPSQNYFLITVSGRSRDSAVGIATGYGLDGRGVGVGVPVGTRIFSSLRCPDRLWDPRSLLSNGYQGLFPRGKAAGSEADHSPPASAKVKKMWIYTSTPPYASMA
jgi:hypothetical protein